MLNTTESYELRVAATLSLEFMNSEERDFRGRWRIDYVFQPAWLEAFFTKWHLDLGVAPTEKDIQALTALRTLMLKIVESLPSGNLTEEDLAALNATLKAAPTIHRLLWETEQFKLAIEPQVQNWQWIMAEIAASFAELLVYGDLQRLKVCENPYCRSIFYDETRSRTRRWCTNETCGNLWKMRRFRAKKKIATQG